ncbi:MAG: hypothetical protein FJ087_02955 [Deltaproteobacteria bacterium]|nr:hypothetical protein [Deltaproteobacteria bacterium]
MRFGWVGVICSLVAASASAAERKVCVEVVLQKPSGETLAGGPDEKAAAQGQQEDGADLPIGQSALAYLSRLIEHFVTHEPGFEAARSGCEETMRVELYPLWEGWTAFVRYSGTGREERVDQLLPSELSAFAERSVTAVLRDQPISTTINRDNVLHSDSKKSTQRIKGTNHFVLDVGTQLRLAPFVPTAKSDGATEKKFRVFSPMELALGYRGKFEAWGVEALAGVGIGTQKTAAKDNKDGGHVDLGGDAFIKLHFLRYLNPRGLTSWYLGAGSTFELLWFTAIRKAGDRDESDRSTLLAGGVTLDGIAGIEFMRASSVQFFLQGELNAPAYWIETANDHGSLKSYLPGVSVKLGVVF